MAQAITAQQNHGVSFCPLLHRSSETVVFECVAGRPRKLTCGYTELSTIDCAYNDAGFSSPYHVFRRSFIRAMTGPLNERNHDLPFEEVLVEHLQCRLIFPCVEVRALLTSMQVKDQASGHV